MKFIKRTQNVIQALFQHAITIHQREKSCFTFDIMDIEAIGYFKSKEKKQGSKKLDQNTKLQKTKIQLTDRIGSNKPGTETHLKAHEFIDLRIHFIH